MWRDAFDTTKVLGLALLVIVLCCIAPSFVIGMIWRLLCFGWYLAWLGAS